MFEGDFVDTCTIFTQVEGGGVNRQACADGDHYFVLLSPSLRGYARVVQFCMGILSHKNIRIPTQNKSETPSPALCAFGQTSGEEGILTIYIFTQRFI